LSDDPWSFWRSVPTHFIAIAWHFHHFHHHFIIKFIPIWWDSVLEERERFALAVWHLGVQAFWFRLAGKKIETPLAWRRALTMRAQYQNST
jgi:hypothetical protein